MNKEIEERVKANIISSISPRNYLETLDQKLVKTDNSVDETYSIKKVNIDKCINVISDEWLKKYCFDVFSEHNCCAIQRRPKTDREVCGVQSYVSVRR